MDSYISKEYIYFGRIVQLHVHIITCSVLIVVTIEGD